MEGVWGSIIGGIILLIAEYTPCFFEGICGGQNKDTMESLYSYF